MDTIRFFDLTVLRKPPGGRRRRRKPEPDPETALRAEWLAALVRYYGPERVAWENFEPQGVWRFETWAAARSTLQALQDR